jgi:hypothetical protein
MWDYPREEAAMSDEREQRLESDEPGEETEDVEAHQRLAGQNALPDVRLAEDEDEGEDVEAHSRLAPKHANP